MIAINDFLIIIGLSELQNGKFIGKIQYKNENGNSRRPVALFRNRMQCCLFLHICLYDLRISTALAFTNDDDRNWNDTIVEKIQTCTIEAIFYLYLHEWNDWFDYENIRETIFHDNKKIKIITFHATRSFYICTSYPKMFRP